MRVYYIQWVPTPQSSTYGECSYYEFPGEDGILGTGDDRNLLVDGGRANYVGDILIPFLRSKIGVGGTLWFMALSSAGEDHYAGLESVVNEFEVMNYYENVRWPPGDKANYDELIAALQAEGANMYTYDAGDYLSGPDTTIGPLPTPGWDPYIEAKVLCANADTPYPGDSDNRWAALIQIRCGESVFLTGGDAIGNDQEYWVINEIPTPSYPGALAELADTDIYKVHHHGSYGSSYQDFMDHMAPCYAVAQMAYGTGPGSHSHPTKEALDRIWSSGGIVYRNDLDDTVLVKCDNLGNFDITRSRAYVDETQTPGGSNDMVYPPPPIPENLQVVGAGDDFISLDWDDVSGAYGYDVFRSMVDGGDPGAGLHANPGCESTGIYQKVNQGNVVASDYTDSGLQPGTTYYYRVSVKKTYTESGYQVCYERRYSNQVSGTTAGGGTPTISATPTVTRTPAAKEQVALMKDQWGDHNLFVYNAPAGGDWRYWDALSRNPSAMARDLWLIPSGNDTLFLAGTVVPGTGERGLSVLKEQYGIDQNLYLYNVPLDGDWRYWDCFARNPSASARDFWVIPAGNNAVMTAGAAGHLAVMKDAAGDYNLYLYNVPAEGDWRYWDAAARNPSPAARDLWIIPYANDAVAMCGLDTLGDGLADSLLVVRNVSSEYRVYVWNLPVPGDWTYADAVARNLVPRALDRWVIPQRDDVELVTGVNRGSGFDELVVMENYGGDYNLYLWNAPRPGDLLESQAIARNPSPLGRDFWIIPSANGDVGMAGVNAR